MHPQLQYIIDEFERAQQHLHALASNTTDALWSKRPGNDRWSVADNIEHLNRTSEIFLPVMQAGVAEARTRGGAAPARMRRDLMGWLLWKVMPPPVKRMRVKTKPRFVPTGELDRARLLSDFDRLQQEQIACVRSADGLAIDRIKITSPIDGKARYNLYACFTILPVHQERHIWQAEQALSTLS